MSKICGNKQDKITNLFCHSNELLSALSLHTADEFLSVAILTSSEVGNNLDLTRYQNRKKKNSLKTQHNAKGTYKQGSINQDFILDDINYEWYCLCYCTML